MGPGTEGRGGEGTWSSTGRPVGRAQHGLWEASVAESVRPQQLLLPTWELVNHS